MALTVKACAKINLTLDILGKREDGYHLLDMLIQSVDLSDILDISLRNDGLIIVSSNDSDLGGENDIAYKSADLFFKKTAIKTGVDIKISKRIPISAGLGGGSSDAAAVLLALNKIFDFPLKKEELEELALNLGADVPYFLTGGAAFVSGIGEKILPIGSMPQASILIAKCGVKKSTGEMYQKIDSLSDLPRPDTDNALLAIKRGDLELLCRSLGNSFSAAWDFAKIEKSLKSVGAWAVSLSGSGPSIFAIFDNLDTAKKAQDLLYKDFSFESFITNPCSKAIYFE